MFSRFSRSGAFGTTIDALIGAGLAFYVKENYFTFSFTKGTSMQPTINDGDVLLVSVRAFDSKNKPSVGDVVMVRDPWNSSTWLCKRITAIEDQACLVKETNVYKRIPKSHIFLEGDNKQTSLDSTTFGPVPTNLIDGKVTYKLWPKFEKIKHETLVRNNGNGNQSSTTKIM